VLLAMGLYYFRTGRPAERSADLPAQSGVAIRPPVATSAPVAPEPASRSVWDEIESADIRQFHANLKAVGCPDKTIRDILLPVIEERYRQRQLEVVRATERSFWQYASNNRQRSRARLEVDKEKVALIQELFGASLDLRALQEWHRRYPMGIALGFMQEGKPEQVLWVASKYGNLVQEIQAETGGVLTPDDRLKMQSLLDQARLDLSAILLPFELEELEARATVVGIAMVFRQGLLGIDMNGLEMRALVVSAIRAGNPFLRSLVSGTRLLPEEEQAIKRQFEQQMQTTLGRERYAEYERLQDQRYQGVALLADKFNVPRKTVNVLYDVFQAGQSEEKKQRDDASLSAQQREAALRQTRQLTEETARRLLGDQVFEAMRKSPFPRF